MFPQIYHFRWVSILAVLTLLGCSSSSQESVGSTASRPVGDTPANIKVAVQLNWYPEAEHGGIYQAVADGTYEKAGFDVDVRSGGRATPVAPELQLGRVQFAMANADDVVLFRREGMDIVAVMAVMQDSPRCILVREDSGVKDFGDLAGMTLQRQTGRLFLEYMRSKGILDQVQEVPYYNSVASMVADPKIAIQAYSFAEPLLAREQGMKVRTLMVSDLGWNPYSSVLITTGKLIREDPQLVASFVEATRDGWRNYLRDPKAGNAAILKANKHGMTPAALEFGSAELRPLAVPAGMDEADVGTMSLKRWQELVDQMEELEPGRPSVVKAEDCFTLDFL
ncbi:NMT1/THI5 like protein [Rubripirellula amarantea]|uniref:NMT1/THI5 like protein n=1 Tax=Rubripirellula amarantea TaxID=2527999 RepID=A0A5C5WQY9_9BACT|nr:ABC transporter substrate-binding protein [Rubripirellula amarantea]TWT52453.1 NMT1/THI5 like protein [Rubripirellula amarantea]